MPSSHDSSRHDEANERTEYMYRGRKVELQQKGDQARLTIDGHEIEMEQHENGILSHAFMFKLFGTPFELAEELIKQWGNANLKDAPPPSEHHEH